MSILLPEKAQVWFHLSELWPLIPKPSQIWDHRSRIVSFVLRHKPAKVKKLLIFLSQLQIYTVL